MRSASFGYTQDKQSLRLRLKRGFTLIELMVAISIVAILATIGLTLFSNAQKTARDGKRRADVSAIAQVMEIYKSKNNTYVIGNSLIGSCNNNGGWWDFSDPTWGVVGNQNGCQSSIKNGLGSLFAGQIPSDPLCPTPDSSSNACRVADGKWGNYVIYEPNGDSFTIFARLENPPSNPCINGSFNYCLKNQQ